MATFYLDTENGNDANNGTTFALRKRNLSSFTGLVGGDVIRTITTPPFTNMGTATWTDNSALISALPTGYIEAVEPGNVAWTAAPLGITTATSTTRKLGTTSSLFNVLAAFASAVFPAQLAFRATAANLNLSAYTGLSFWMRKTTSGGNLFPDGRFRIRLCSDALGLVSLQELSFTYPNTSGGASIVQNQWTPVVLQTNAALPSGINSVAIYMSSDPGACSFIVHNMVAIKGDSNAQHISHRSVISKNTVGEPLAYPINAFVSNTSLQISPHGSDPTTLRNYRGVTETVNTWALRPINPFMTTAQRTLGMSGADGNPIILSGGWDATAMSVQSGHSVWGGDYYFGSAIALNSRLNWRIEGMSLAHYASGPFTLTGARNIETRLTHFIGGISPAVTSNATLGSQGDTTIDYVTMCDTAVQNGTVSNTAPCVFRSKHISGGLAGGILSGGANSEDTDFINEIDQITNCGGTAVSAQTAGQVVTLRGCTFNFNVGNIAATTVGTIADSCTFLDGFKISAPTGHSGYAYLTNIGNDPQIHRQIHFGFEAFTQAAVVNTPGGKAWEITVSSGATRTMLAPARILLATVAVLGGGPVTLSARVRRTTGTSFNAGIRCSGKIVQGVTEQTALATLVGAWETLSVTINPTVNGVVELWGFAAGSVASAYFDDITVS